jgi:hypothetical protein
VIKYNGFSREFVKLVVINEFCGLKVNFLGTSTNPEAA